MTFAYFISFVILLRIGELYLSQKNEKWLLQNGAVEYGRKHYPVIVTLHILFFLSLLMEYSLQQAPYSNYYLIGIYFLLITFKFRIILSLGKFWNTKIYHIPGAPLIKTGIYKYIKHPNYIVVIAEIAIIPAAFHLYYTAIIFTLLNLIVLRVRIKEENKALII
jgi:methyltransferase